MKNKYLKTDVDGYIKDTHSGAVLNVDNAKLEAYKKQKMAMEQSRMTTERLKKVENDINDIKKLLQQLVSK